jgi:Tfp pilus assembly protein PilX
MRRLHRDESGIVLVVAMLVIATTLALGLATFAFTQDQQRQTGNERVKESAFNLAESALNSATNYMSSNFPTSTSPYPTCTQAGGAGCPDAATVASGFSSSDYAGAPTWTTNVYDNGAPTTSFYRAGTTDTQPSYDANGDGKLWVRASATARGKTRTVVALVKAQPISETFPRNVVTAGMFWAGTDNIRFPFVDERGTSAVTSSVAVTCTQAGPPTLSPTFGCLYFKPGKGALSDEAWQQGVTLNACPDASLKCAMTDADLDRLRKTAKAQGNYYATGCPTNAQAAANGIVFVEGTPGGGCILQNAGTVHSPANPGVYVLANGQLSLSGGAQGTKFYGLVYVANRAHCTSCNVLSVTSGTNGSIIGAAVADWDGAINLGVNFLPNPGSQIQYDPNVFNLLQTTGAMTAVPGTFREL